MSGKQIEQYEKDRALIEAELYELAESDRTASFAQKVTNQQRRQVLNSAWAKLEEKRNASGRNTAEEYEAWQRELNAARDAEKDLNSEYLSKNKQMYNQENIVSSLEKDVARRSETRKKINELDEKNLRDTEKQKRKDEKNKKEIERIEENLNFMTIEYLKEQQLSIKTKIKNAKNLKNRSRLEDKYQVYSEEINRRERRGAEAGQRVVGQSLGKGITGTLASNINMAGDVAADAAMRQKVDLEAAAKVLQAAVNTKSKLDNSAAMEMYKVIQNLLTVTQKQSREYMKMKQNYEKLTKIAQDPTR